MAKRVRRAPRTSEIWPGFVDALSTLLMVIIFLLVAFMLAQYFLSVALSGRDEALDRLSRQVSELADLLSLERQANAELRLDIAQLSSELQSSTATRDVLSAQLTSILSERDTLVLRLEAATDQAALAAAEAEALRDALAEADKTIATDRETLELKLAELASLRSDIAMLRKVRGELEAQLSQLAAALQANQADLETTAAALDTSTAELDDSRALATALRADLTAERDRAKTLEARLSDETERTALAQKEIDDREIRLNELRLALQQSDEELTREHGLSARSGARIELLNQQITALRKQLARLAEALDIAAAEAEAQGVVISDLGRKLNLALAGKVEELQRYRSEFFGRLREVLGNRPGIHIVDDRFVFQSEVLFASGSATLEEAGREQMAQLARTLLEIAREIPSDLPWIMRVDGHTDTIPIYTSQFPSNWELSTSRAISVVRFLVAEGVPPHRLVAAGFGEHQPIDPRSDEIGFRRNRRIELKLTSR